MNLGPIEMNLGPIEIVIMIGLGLGLIFMVRQLVHRASRR
jgi:hypothetical protein